MSVELGKVQILSDLEITMSREFDAPRELVYKAFTDPELIPQWWGLRNSTTVVDKLDFQVGGGWRFVQKMEDGTEYGFRGEFLAIDPPKHIKWTFEFEPMPGHVTQDDVTFVDLNGRTRIDVLSTFSSIEDRDGMINSGMEGGANESYDRLAELLVKLQAS